MKVAIVGGASSWVNAPFSDEDWQVWVLGNQLDRYEGKRVSRVFEIHDCLDEHDKVYPQWLVAHNLPMVVSEKFPIKDSRLIVFNYEEAIKLTGDNFSSSPAVMMAQAIMDGATHISIYGVDMALDLHEYFMQRPCMEQWIGYAKGRGIEVYIDQSSPLGYSTYREGRDWPSKGFDGFDEGEFAEMYNLHKKRFDTLEHYINSETPKIEAMKAEYHALNGAMQVYDRLQKVARAKAAGIDVELING